MLKLISEKVLSGSMTEKEETTKALLRKLLYMGKWAGNHTSFDNLPKGFPKHLRGEVKEAAKELIRTGILLSKPTAYGLEVSLNVKLKKGIEEMLK